MIPFVQKALLAFSVSFLFLAGCTTVEPREEASFIMMKNAPSKSDPNYDPDQLVCKFKPATGSRLGRVKDCRTARMWERSGTNAQRAINEMSNTQVEIPDEQ